MKHDKISAYQTLFQCLLEISKLIAPVAPFFADKLYQDLTAVLVDKQPESVHLADFSVSDESFIDKGLEEKMHKLKSFRLWFYHFERKKKSK